MKRFSVFIASIIGMVIGLPVVAAQTPAQTLSACLKAAAQEQTNQLQAAKTAADAERKNADARNAAAIQNAKRRYIESMKAAGTDVVARQNAAERLKAVQKSAAAKYKQDKTAVVEHLKAAQKAARDSYVTSAALCRVKAKTSARTQMLRIYPKTRSAGYWARPN